MLINIGLLDINDSDDDGSSIKPKQNGRGSGDKNSLPKETHDETVVLLRNKKVDGYIDIELNL